MCGFVGSWSAASSDLVAQLAQRLAHRGPDGAGIYVSPDRKIAFAHVRLAIVDLRSGGQPMANEDGTIWVGFNGEIYNHLELRRELERAGHRYRTSSDTETLIHAYEEYGDDFVTRLNGEFAFVLYDERRGVGLLARDRLGIRPLYYAEHARHLYFASEIHALRGIPGFAPEVDPSALDQYLALRYCSGEQSILKGVRRLPPGTTLRLDLANAAPRRYWSLPTTQQAWSEDDAIARLDELLTESVRLRLMSDVPLGMYLSGGVDSGLILALMAREVGRVRTFTIGFDLPLDETETAAAVAKRFGAQHTEVRLPPRAYESLSDVAAALDEPLGDAIVLPTYFLSQAAARELKVVLTGEGADELFGSYVHQHALAQYARYRRALPTAFRGIPPAVVDRVPLSLLNRLFRYPESLGEAGRRRVSTFLRNAENGRAYLTLVELFTREERQQLLAPDRRARPALSVVEGPEWEAAFASAAWDDRRYLESAIDVDCRHWLPDYTLVKQDRLTMANSIEGRVPFLDHRLVEFALSLPSSMKMRRGNLKYLLRVVAERYVGKETAWASKAAFYLPFRKCFGADFDVFVRDTLSASSIRRDGYFDPTVVDRLVERGLADSLLDSKRLMAVLMFTLWSRRAADSRRLTAEQPAHAEMRGATA